MQTSIIVSMKLVQGIAPNHNVAAEPVQAHRPPGDTRRLTNRIPQVSEAQLEFRLDF